jgi:hypothetical protein
VYEQWVPVAAMEDFNDYISSLRSGSGDEGPHLVRLGEVPQRLRH